MPLGTKIVGWSLDPSCTSNQCLLLLSSSLQIYVKRLLKHLEEKRPERVESFKAEAMPAVQKIVDSFDQWQFFLGESQDATAMVVLMDWKDDKTPYMLFFKDGLIEEKM